MHVPRITLHRLHQIWALTAFSLVFGRLVLLRGADIRLFLLFVVPPLAALLVATRAAGRGSRLVANLFLAAITFGLAVAPFPQVFPALGGIERKLGQTADRTLAWYTGVYLLFFSVVFPAFAAISSLRRNRRGETAELSSPVCVLILVTIAALGPPLAVITVRVIFLGLPPR